MPQTGGLAHHVPQLVRYGGVGLCCVGLNLAVLYVGTGLFGLHYIVSVAIAFGLVAPFGYWLHKVVAFRDKSPPTVAQAMRYLAGFTGGAVLNVAAMAILVDGLGVQYLLANLVVTGLYFVGSYGVQAFWTFVHRA